VHTFAMVLIRPYGDVASEIGRSLSHGNDIADIPRLVLIGYVGVGVHITVLCGFGASNRQALISGQRDPTRW